MELVPNEQLSDVKQLDILTQKTKLLKQEIGKIIIVIISEGDKHPNIHRRYQIENK